MVQSTPGPSSYCSSYRLGSAPPRTDSATQAAVACHVSATNHVGRAWLVNSAHHHLASRARYVEEVVAGRTFVGEVAVAYLVFGDVASGVEGRSVELEVRSVGATY